MIREMPHIVPDKEALERAKGEILALRSEIGLMGFNDYEIPTIDRVLGELERGEIEPAEAVETVHRIKSSKQDYH